ncbi:hypothetical protein M5689_012853 [Euphorbia peplus]|nr:hypothetical protein M5689_012853 [Euphorbia peplus]
MEIRAVSPELKFQKLSSDSADIIDEQLVVEEEALSLCDLPVNSNKDDHKSIEAAIQENEKDFDFELCGGTLSSPSEMCSADDIFFKGQILPFRTSEISNPNPKIQCLSRSESVEAFSSRSSSSRSQFSSSSSSGSSTRISRPRIQNQFFFNNSSSPKPQIRTPNSSTGNRNRRSSTTWDFFRLSLVHTPEIELHDLKARNSVSRNSSTSSSNSNNNNNSKKQGKQRKQSMLLSGCNCTVNSVKSVPYIRIENQESEEKKKKKKMKNEKKKKEKAKEGMSNHRTFEWIKELSNSNFVDQDEGHT